MRLIDADAFYKKIEEIRMEYLEEDTLSSKFAAEIIETVMDSYLQDAPTIDPVKQEWISVKDRLPEVEERVLVYSYEDGINFGYFLGYEDGFFIDCVYPNEPTHWMPLPEPPKEWRVSK